MEEGHQPQTQDQSGPSQAISTSFFPPPPSVYGKFTSRNLRLLRVVQSHQLGPEEKPWDQLEPQERIQRQNVILRKHYEKLKLVAGDGGFEKDGDATMKDEERIQPSHHQGEGDFPLPDFDLMLELEKPRVDWIEQDGHYHVFGQTWPIPDVTPTLEELGIPTLHPPGVSDRKSVLISLLNTLLHTYHSLTSDLLKPVQIYDVWVPTPIAPPFQPDQGQGEGRQEQQGFWTQSTEAKDRLKHVQNVVINMQFLINELRPTQAKETLKLMMQTQLDRRRRETVLIKNKCEAMRERIREIQQMMRQD
ncbi:hypothetical protein IE53DRAFT_386211 [Violaceomyces palustris]|uniref:Uncharacterized protein n=1 Tax=Violaceomyces palustris TaxID=1673888 RepID=A0ACD0NZZ9_9BASI|nr:hypothetical protein IE53DRAFT_386211 [Violaceomyces palustris]